MGSRRVPSSCESGCRGCGTGPGAPKHGRRRRRARVRPGPDVRAPRARRHRDPRALARCQRSDHLHAMPPPNREPARRPRLEAIGDLSRPRSCGRARLIVPVPTWDDFVDLALVESGAPAPTNLRSLGASAHSSTGSATLCPPGRQPTIARHRLELDEIVETAFTLPHQRAFANHADAQGIGGPQTPFGSFVSGSPPAATTHRALRASSPIHLSADLVLRGWSAQGTYGEHIVGVEPRADTHDEGLQTTRATSIQPLDPRFARSKHASSTCRERSPRGSRRRP